MTELDFMSLRIGHGYDVHRFCENRPLILGGVTIPYEKGLSGHSDADVLTHALCDALLGAMSLPDIGKLFPDNDPQYEGISSLILLEKVRERAETLGFVPIHVDCTIVAQAPKLSPHIDEIKKSLAAVLRCAPEQVGVKATTEEHLGFTGRKEGIAAHAVCLMYGKNP